MQPINSQVKAAIISELNDWKTDGHRNAADSLVRIAEMLHTTGADIDLPGFYAKRDSDR